MTLLAADLCGYQDADHALAFLDHVAEAAEAERNVGPVGPLTGTVARSFHKLMAYKDEYEVARLLLLPEARATAEAVEARAAKVRMWPTRYTNPGEMKKPAT